MKHIVFSMCVACLSTSALSQQTTSYHYDALGRLEKSETSGGPSDEVVTDIAYDPAGNRSNYTVKGSTGPQTAPDPNYNYAIQVVHSGLCLNAVNSGTTDGTNLDQASCSGDANQNWHLRQLDGGYYQISNAHAGAPGKQVLDVYEQSVANQANVITYQWLGNANQQWLLDPVAAGMYNIVNRNSNQNLEVIGSQTQSGAKIVQYARTPYDNQKWRLLRNHVRNNGFETGNKDRWLVWSGNNTPYASYVEGGPYSSYSGAYRLTHYSPSPFQVYTYQDITDIKNGNYTLSARVSSSGGHSVAFLSAKGFDSSGVELKADLLGAQGGGFTPTLVRIRGIPVRNNRLTVGIYTLDGSGGHWISVDDVALIAQGELDSNRVALRDKLQPYRSGKASPITIATFGNSHGTGQGTSAANQPGEQLKAVLQSFLPGVEVIHRNYAVPGSWQAQLGEQIDKMTRDAVVPDIVLILDPANDGLTSIYNGLEGPDVYRDRLSANIRRFREAGAVVLSHTTPLPHPTRSLASGRFDFSPDFFATYPTVSWVSFNGYQNFTFDAAARTITSSVKGQFTIFSPGWVVPGGWLRGSDDGAFHHIAAVDSTGTAVTVDDGKGGPSFTSNRSTTAGMWIGRIDAKTQLTPARNEDDLSRPKGVANDVPLALERRDINSNGVPILASTRHLSLNQIAREVTAQEGAVLIDWGAEFQKLLSSDAAYDGLYPNNDDFHPGDQGYRLLTPVYRELVGSVL